jgi:hypothetical protein
MNVSPVRLIHLALTFSAFGPEILYSVGEASANNGRKANNRSVEVQKN